MVQSKIDQTLASAQSVNGQMPFTTFSFLKHTHTHTHTHTHSIEPPPDGVVIPNAVASSAPGSQPGTPVSTRSTSEVITNKSAMEAGSAGNSQEDNEVNKVSRGRGRGARR